MEVDKNGTPACVDPNFANFVYRLTGALVAAGFPAANEGKGATGWILGQSGRADDPIWQGLYRKTFSPKGRVEVELEVEATPLPISFKGKPALCSVCCDLILPLQSSFIAFDAPSIPAFTREALDTTQRWLFSFRGPLGSGRKNPAPSADPPEFFLFPHHFRYEISPNPLNENSLTVRAIQLRWLTNFLLPDGTGKPSLSEQAAFFVERVSGFWAEWDELATKHFPTDLMWKR